MGNSSSLGVVRARYGPLRRTLLPIYGVDQLVTFSLLAIPFVLLATVNPRLAMFTGLGAYVGVATTMQRSTPSSLMLAATEEQRVAEILDGSPYFKRAAHGTGWDSTKGRLQRWDTDNIRLERTGNTICLTGRQIDLQKLVYLLAT